MRLAGAAALLALGATACEAAEGYPARPVRLVVAFTAGGPVDITARAIAPKLGEALGQTVVIDNRGGAGGIIGTDLVAKAAPDGHTFLMCSSSNTIQPSLMAKLPYDFGRDLAPVSLAAIVTSILVVHPGVAARSVQELIALARAKPGVLTYASTGSGTPTHLAAELFRTMAGVDIVHVPYKGGAPAAIDLLAGQVQLSFISAPAVMQHVKSGRLRALAVTNARRSQVLPDIPTVAESGLPGYESEGWHAMCAPAATPAAILDRVNREVVAVLRMPDVAAHLMAGGVEPQPTGRAEFATRIRAEIAKWARVAKAAGLQAH